MGLRKFIELVKWSWRDACDPSHSCLNVYHEEKGYKEWNILIPKGEYLEKQTFETLSKLWGCGLKKLLVDLYIPSVNPLLDTSQLDVVLVNKSGIYCIEVKNFNAKLKGYSKDNKWIKTYSNGKKEEVPSPVKQNTNHVKALQELFPDYPKEYFKNIVVCADTCRIEYEQNNDLPYETFVINYNYVKSLIKVMTKESEEVFSDENIYRIYNELSQYARADYETRVNHVEKIKSLYNS
ncbi:MAG: nuclease-related domain-containing protein [Sarcina sp.]